MKFYISVILIGLLISCGSEPQKDHKIENSGAVDEQAFTDQVQIGMSIHNMKDHYTEAEFIPEPVYKYGIDGESDGILVKKGDDPLFFAWTLENSDTIRGITILSKNIPMKDSVHVGMKLRDFIEKHPRATLRIDILNYSYEYSCVSKFEYCAEFISSDTTRVAQYDYDEPEPEFIDIQRAEATIDRISIR